MLTKNCEVVLHFSIDSDLEFVNDLQEDGLFPRFYNRRKIFYLIQPPFIRGNFFYKNSITTDKVIKYLETDDQRKMLTLNFKFLEKYVESDPVENIQD